MKKIINFSPLLEETTDPNALTYLIKLFLKEKEGLPIVINPNNIVEECIEVEYGKFSYAFILDENFKLEYEYEK